MIDFITVEPSDELRSQFALWSLRQTPTIRTTSTGFTLTADQYAAVPSELLRGAYVDGFANDYPTPQPVAAEPVASPLAAETAGPLDAGVPASVTKPRKRAASKRAGVGARKPSDVGADDAEDGDS
jgi:hypothetical protein